MYDFLTFRLSVFSDFLLILVILVILLILLIWLILLILLIHPHITLPTGPPPHSIRFDKSRIYPRIACFGRSGQLTHAPISKSAKFLAWGVY